MSATMATDSHVILIGPVNAGKSTIAALLADRLGLPWISLDAVCWWYYAELGFDNHRAQRIRRNEGYDAYRRYADPFYIHAVERVLADNEPSVIDFGAGHSVYADITQRVRAAGILAPYPNVVLLLPSPDPDRSIRLLAARMSNPLPEIVAMNELFVRDPSNQDLAKITAYTEGKTLEQTANEILQQIESSRGCADQPAGGRQ